MKFIDMKECMANNINAIIGELFLNLSLPLLVIRVEADPGAEDLENRNGDGDHE